MRYCQNCGKAIEETDNFCSNCGTSVTNNKSETKRITKYEGTIHKCPNCGDEVTSFEVVCSNCGYEFRDTTSSEALKNFEQKWEELIRNKSKNGKSDNYEDKLDLIRNFAIPNNKEDIYEFMILASSNISGSAYEDEDNDKAKELANAWTAKFEQAYEKAKIYFDGDNRLDNLQRMYETKRKEVKSGKRKPIYKTILIVLGCLFLMLGPATIMNIVVDNEDKNLENELKQIVEEVQADYENENYDSALMKAQKIYFDYHLSHDKSEHWDEVRENLIEMIEEAKKNKE